MRVNPNEPYLLERTEKWLAVWELAHFAVREIEEAQKCMVGHQPESMPYLESAREIASVIARVSRQWGQEVIP